MRVLAVASGTSADELDVGVVDLAVGGGELVLEVVSTTSEPWPAGLREAVLAVLPPATTTAAALCDLDQQIGQAVAEVVVRTNAGLSRPAHLVVSPGQTVFHDVRDGHCAGTLQLGQPAWLAERTGLPVVSDLRARDVAAGGHGAPLASTLDALWLAGPGGPRAALNLGGIANVTVVGDAFNPVVAWDTGPANCLLDLAAARISDGVLTRDDDGRLALVGRVRPDLLDALLEHPHFARRPPVSTGREAFSATFLDEALSGLPAVADADLMATLTELTAETVSRALTPYAVTEVVASGGGVHNPALMDALARCLGDTPLVTSDERGLPVDGKEVVMWALLGFLTWHGLPGATTATGATAQRMLGRISPGHEPLRMPQPVLVVPRRLRIVAAAPVGGIS